AGYFFFSSRRRHTRFSRDWSSDVCSSDLGDRAVRSGERHHHFDVAVLAYLDAVDQPEIVDVHRDFGIVYALQRLDHAFIERAAGLGGVLRLRLLREEAFEIVALALELLVRGFLGRVVEARAGRRCDVIHFFNGGALVGFLPRPNILLLRSTPRRSAATSSSLL